MGFGEPVLTWVVEDWLLREEGVGRRGTLTGARFNPTYWWPKEEEKDVGEGAGTPRATPRGEETEGVAEEDDIEGPEETDGNWECLVLLGVVIVVVAADKEGFGSGLGLRLGFGVGPEEAAEEGGCGGSVGCLAMVGLEVEVEVAGVGRSMKKDCVIGGWKIETPARILGIYYTARLGIGRILNRFRILISNWNSFGFRVCLYTRIWMSITYYLQN
ncbi:unnamed protein product [Dovyalis caffra]|uniref:Uncharacterized protein n=1 Tax=Dovyalis caffra TaxID=77055 RepID=A0AAV1RFM4_9ROSI|nr:unnamed protein product [Dovyalis caffra]